MPAGLEALLHPVLAEREAEDLRRRAREGDAEQLEHQGHRALEPRVADERLAEVEGAVDLELEQRVRRPGEVAVDRRRAAPRSPTVASAVATLGGDDRDVGSRRPRGIELRGARPRSRRCGAPRCACSPACVWLEASAPTTPARRSGRPGGASTVMLLCCCPIDRRARVEGDTRAPSLRIYRPIDRGQERIAATLHASSSPRLARRLRSRGTLVVLAKDLRIEVVDPGDRHHRRLLRRARRHHGEPVLRRPGPRRPRGSPPGALWLADRLRLRSSRSGRTLAARAGGVGAPGAARLARAPRGHLVRQGARRPGVRAGRRAASSCRSWPCSSTSSSCRVLGPLAAVMLLGTVGVAATGTLFGAMTVRTRARELLLATVLFPLLSPALLSSVAATREIFYAAASGQPVDMGEVGDWLLLLGVFDAVAIAGRPRHVRRARRGVSGRASAAQRSAVSGQRSAVGRQLPSFFEDLRDVERRAGRPRRPRRRPRGCGPRPRPATTKPRGSWRQLGPRLGAQLVGRARAARRPAGRRTATRRSPSAVGDRHLRRPRRCPRTRTGTPRTSARRPARAAAPSRRPRRRGRRPRRRPRRRDPPARHPVAEQPPARAGAHHARPVVALEGEDAVVGARREHERPRRDHLDARVARRRARRRRRSPPPSSPGAAVTAPARPAPPRRPAAAAPTAPRLRPERPQAAAPHQSRRRPPRPCGPCSRARAPPPCPAGPDADHQRVGVAAPRLPRRRPPPRGSLPEARHAARERLHHALHARARPAKSSWWFMPSGKNQSAMRSTSRSREPTTFCVSIAHPRRPARGRS